MRRSTLSTLALALVWATPVAAQDEKELIRPFNEMNLDGWKLKGPEDRSQWQVGTATLDANNPRELAFQATDQDGALVNVKGGGVDISTEEQFGDAVIEIEFMVPQNSNSGLYVMGEYEVQILDSFGKDKLGQGDLGAIYSAAAPPINASKRPGEWQKFVIHFRAPRFKDGEKVENAKFLLVELNDQILHKDVEVKGPTPGGLTGKEAPTGPIMFQGDHGPVAYRDIVIRPQEFD